MRCPQKSAFSFFGYSHLVSEALPLAGGGDSPPEEMQLEALVSLV